MNKTLYVKPETKQELDSICPKNVTYDEFIKKLLDFAKVKGAIQK